MNAFRASQLGSVSLLLAFLAVIFPPDALAQAPGGRPPMPVAVLAAHKADVAVEYSYPGRTAGSQYVEVRARVGGILVEKSYTEGEPVKRGDLLYRIDDERYRAALARAEAQLKMEQARLRKAQRDWKRIESLFSDQAVSQQNRDATLSELELAEAGVAAARAALNEVRIDLDYTEVRAEIDGVAGLKRKDVGDLVGTSGDNSLLTTITRLDPINVEFAIPDSEAEIQRRQIDEGKLRLPADGRVRVRLRLGATGDYPLEGVMDFTDTRVDTRTGGVNARARFPNPDHVLLPGQFVRVVLGDLVRPGVFTVPQKAVMQLGEQAFVYVAEEGKAQFRPVVLAGVQGENWLVESGLAEGDQVIVSNLIKLRPGSAVQPLPAKAPDSAEPGSKGE